MTKMITKKQQRGFSLIEVLVTAVIMAVGLLAIAGLQFSGIKNAHNALLETQARYIASSLLNQIRENPDGLSDYLVHPADLPYGCTTAPTPSCMSIAMGTTACSSTELATSEQFHSICGNKVSSVENGGINNELPNASMTIECIAADGTFGNDCTTNDVTIGITWDERELDNDGGTTQHTIRITGSI